jgi:peptidoglycan/xylan/chitin deacetylase (PgdA/CDA1 family)
LDASPEWKACSGEFIAPADATGMRVYHSLVAVGELTIDNVKIEGDGLGGTGSVVNPSGYLAADRIIEMEQAGHEIGSHTRSHAHLTDISEAEARDEIFGSRQALLDAGIQNVNSFVYPYGEYNAEVVQMVQDAGYDGARIVTRGYNNASDDEYTLRIQAIYGSTTIEEVRQWIAEAKASNTWLIFMHHQIDDSGNFYGNSPEMLQAIIDEIKAQDLKTVTVREGLNMMDK